MNKKTLKIIERLRRQGVLVSGAYYDEQGILHIVLENKEEVNKLMQFTSTLPKEFKIETGKFTFHKFRIKSAQINGYYIMGVDNRGERWLCSPNANGVTNYHCTRDAVELYLMQGTTQLYRLNVVAEYPYISINYFDASLVDHSVWQSVDVKAVLFAGDDRYAVLFDGSNTIYKSACVRDLACRLSTTEIGDVLYGYPWDYNAGNNVNRTLKVVGKGIAFVLDDSRIRLFRNVLYAKHIDSYNYPSIPGYSGSPWFSGEVPPPNPA